MSVAQNSKTAPKPLSAKSIENLKPGMFKSDAGENTGLRVTCGKTGLKTFFYRYKSPSTGKLVQLKIGSFPTTSLAEARVELAKLKQLRRSGICPKEEKERAKQEEQDKLMREQQLEKEESFTVKALVDLYLEQYIEDRIVVVGGKTKRIAGARKPKGQVELRRTLYADAVRRLGDVTASQVTRKMVVDLIREIIDRGANVQAGNVLRELSSAYEFAIGLNYFSDDFANPALLAKASLQQSKIKLTNSKGKRVLTDDELREVLAWLPNSAFSQKQKQILMLTLYTGCRTGEWVEAKWQDIDLVEGVYHIRETKNGSERNVQLSSQAIALLSKIEKADSPYIFPSKNKNEPIKQKSLTEAIWRMKNPEKACRTNRRKIKEEQQWLSSIDNWTPHDLRRTVRSGLARMGCPNEVGEAVLGHSKKGIEGTYNLHAYEPECKKWLQAWCDHISQNI